MYGPKKTHVHIDDPTKCVWCGSSSIGTGCPFNPFGRYHQRGYSFNPLALEAFENGIIGGLLISKLSESITDMRAYELGLIDSNGRRLREPETLEERNALTLTDKFILQLKNLTKKSIDLLNTKLYIEGNENDDYSVEDMKKIYPIEFDCKNELKDKIESLYEMIDSYQRKGLPASKIEKMIVEALLDVRNEKGL